MLNFTDYHKLQLLCFSRITIFKKYQTFIFALQKVIRLLRRPYHYFVYAKLGLGGPVVASLVNKLPSEASFDVTFNNLLISISLLNHLSENVIGGTGTLKANGTDHCPIEDLKVIGKEHPGSYDYKLYKKIFFLGV